MLGIIPNRKERRRTQKIFDGYGWVLIHQQGCGGVAFYYKQRPNDQSIEASSVKMLNGYVPHPHDQCRCSSCAATLGDKDVASHNFMRVQ